MMMDSATSTSPPSRALNMERLCSGSPRNIRVTSPNVWKSLHIVLVIFMVVLVYCSNGVTAIRPRLMKPSLSARYVYGSAPLSAATPIRPIAAPHVQGALATVDAQAPALPPASVVPAPPDISLGGTIAVPVPAGGIIRRRAVIPKDTIIYHSTNLIFPSGKFYDTNATWFTHDPTEGLKMYILAALVAQRDTGKAPTDMYVRSAKAKRNLNLYVMSPTQAQSLAHLVATYDFPPTGTWPGQAVAAPWTWYGLTSTTAPAAAFIKMFCAHMTAPVHVFKGRELLSRKFDGWRNPYDQDEIMLCPGIDEKVDLLPNEYRQCTAAKYTSVIGIAKADGYTQPDCDALQPYIVTKREEAAGGALQRMHYQLFTRRNWCEAQEVDTTPNVIDPRLKHFRAPTIQLITVTQAQPYDIGHRIYDQLCDKIVWQVAKKGRKK